MIAQVVLGIRIITVRAISHVLLHYCLNDVSNVVRGAPILSSMSLVAVPTDLCTAVCAYELLNAGGRKDNIARRTSFQRVVEKPALY